MNIFLCLLLFFGVYEIRSKNQSLNMLNVTDEWHVSYKSNILINLIEFIAEITETSLIDKYLLKDSSCRLAVTDALKTNKDKLEDILNFSGKGLSDAGIEDDCKTSNYSYLFINYTVDPDNFAKMNEINDRGYYSFLQQKSFFMGLCMFRECNEFFIHAMNYSENKVFFEYLKTHDIQNLTLYKLDYTDNKETAETQSSSQKLFILKILLWIVVAYIIIRFCINILGYLFYDNDAEEDEDRGMITSKDTDFSFEESQMQSDPSNLSLSKEMERRNLLRPILKNKEKAKRTYFYRVYKVLSFKRNLRILFQIKSRYYDETNLDIMSCLRIFTIFFLTFSDNIYTLSKLPHRDFGGYSFYSSFFSYLLELSSFNFDIFFALNGIFFGYKFMSYIKDKEIKFKYFCIFYFNFISKLIVFMITFFVFHLFLKEFGYLLGSFSIYEYFIDTYINVKRCIQEPYLILIPFYLQYGVESCTSDNTLPLCFRYVYLLFSEFYCLTFVMLLFYILMRIRSKKLDLIIFIINWINFVLLYFYFPHNIKGANYSFEKMLGEQQSSVYPHLFFITYFLGINVGIVWFYNNNITSQANPDPSNYTLLSYNFKIMQFLDRKSDTFKLILMIVTILIQVLISCTFYFQLLGKDNLVIIADIWCEIIFIYKSKVYTVFFLIFILSLLFYSIDNTLKKFLSSKLFIPFSRLSFIFFCSADFLTYYLYSIYNIQIYLNYQNLIFMSLGLLIIIMIFSLIIMVLFEMPVRMAYKTLIGSKKKKIRTL
jgi:hypothetical protein